MPPNTIQSKTKPLKARAESPKDTQEWHKSVSQMTRLPDLFFSICQ